MNPFLTSDLYDVVDDHFVLFYHQGDKEVAPDNNYKNYPIRGPCDRPFKNQDRALLQTYLL